MEKPPRNPNVAPPPYSQSFIPLPPQPQIITTTVVVQSYGPEPMDIQCPYCASHIRTRLDFKIGALTWILCIFLGILVCLCDCTKDVEHFCPRCYKYLGIYKRL